MTIWSTVSVSPVQTWPKICASVNVLWHCGGADYLHESHSSHEDQQRQPLVDAQPAAKHRHGEQSCGQNLQLVRHLVETQREISTNQAELMGYLWRPP